MKPFFLTKSTGIILLRHMPQCTELATLHNMKIIIIYRARFKEKQKSIMSQLYNFHLIKQESDQQQ